MKNTNYLINGVLAIAVIILFILYFTGNRKSSGSDTTVAFDSTAVKLPIAYVNSDSMLINYNFAKELNESMLRKVEDSRASINKKQKQWEAEYIKFQENLSNNAFLTRERAQQEQERLGRKQAELEELAMHAQEELGMEQARVTRQITDTILSSLKVFNETKHYQIIFNKIGTTPILIADDTYDITKEFTDFLNSRYTPKAK